LSRPDHSFAHVHHTVSQLFTYPSMSQMSGMSGVISPTNLTMFTSPVTTPRTTPRTTPIPHRWNSSNAFMPLDESNLDYGMMSSLLPSTNPDVDPPHIMGAEDRFFSVVQSPDDGTAHTLSTHANTGSGSGGGPGSTGSGSTPPTPTQTS
jgi:hypothetical protein